MTTLPSWSSSHARAKPVGSANNRACSRLRLTMLAGIVAVAAIVAPLALRPAPRLVWNMTPSAPIGLYLVSPGAPATRGDMVVARLPPGVRTLADRRRYVPASVPVVKRIGAVAGDGVCADGPWLWIAGRRVARRLARDRRGRPLSEWRGCRTLAASEILLLGGAADSFDGRYFGPQSRSTIIGTARLIWAR